MVLLLLQRNIKLVLHSAMCTEEYSWHTHEHWPTQLAEHATQHGQFFTITSPPLNDLSKLESDPCKVAYVLLRVGRCSACRLPLFLSRQWSQPLFFKVISDPNLPYTLFLPPAGHLNWWWCCVCQIERIQIYAILCGPWMERTSDGSTWWRRSRRHVDRRTHTLLARSMLPFIKLNPVRLRSEARMVSACTKDGWITAEVIDQLITSGCGC